MRKGIFTISLDFELFWGVRDHRTINDYGENIHNVHRVVPALLELFTEFEIHCTWATVGFLFFNDKQELIKHLPADRPTYEKKDYDPYQYLIDHELEPVFHFAPDIIERIKNTPGQEVATHTFSHFYTLEKNTSIGQFRSDLRAAVDIAKQKNTAIRSIVFPRNQYSDEHIKVCHEEGLRVYRGNEESGAYKPVSRDNENIFRRAVRLADTYVNLTGHHCYRYPEQGEIINVPASRFLRPYDSRYKLFDGLKLKRIQKGLKYAADHSQIFHLWWHPHNFGSHFEENFSFLRKVLQFYRQLNHQDKIESKNLIEIFSLISKDHE